MGSGMLWAALAGGANAGMKIMDDATRREDEERKRQLTVADRRNELLFEMKAKADMARSAEQEDAQKYDGAVGRADQAGDERRFSKFRDDIRATGGGEGMDESQLRDVFNQSYNQKQSTTEAGGDRYVEPESRNKADVLDELRKGGASGGLLKTAREDLQATQRAEQQARSEALKDRQLEQRDKQFNALLDHQNELAEKRNQTALDVAEKRSSGKVVPGGLDQTEKLTVLKDVKSKADATRPKRSDYSSEKKYTEAMTKWSESEDGQISQDASRQIRSIFGGIGKKGGDQEEGVSAPQDPTARADGDVSALRREIDAVRNGTDKPEVKAERLAILQRELADAEGRKTGVQLSTKKDNRSIIAPAKIGTQAEYQALPKGARYVAPDGTIRTKG